VHRCGLGPPDPRPATGACPGGAAASRWQAGAGRPRTAPARARRGRGARQDAGPLGTGAHGQGVVRAPYGAEEPTSRAPVPGPLTARRALPEAWATARARRAQGRVPPAVTLQTQPARACALVEQARAWGVPCAPVVPVAGSGAPPTCLQGLDARQVADVVGVSSPCGGRRRAAVRATARVPPPRPRRRGPPQPPPPAPRSAAKAGRAARPAERGQTSTGREAAAPILHTQVAAVRGQGATGGAPLSTSHQRGTTGPEGGRRGARPGPGARGAVPWDCSHRPEDTPRPRLGELAHSRWPLEQCDEDATGAGGLDPDQGRRGDGRPRHLALVLLAARWLACQRGTPADPAGLSPRWGALVLPSDAPPGAAVALPRCRVVAHRHQPDRSCPPQADLTK